MDLAHPGPATPDGLANPGSTKGSASANRWSREGEVYSGVDGYEVARRMGIETDTRLYPVLRYLHARILNYTVYPETLIRADRQGRVTVQFEVDERGRLSVPGILSLSSPSQMLGVHVLRTLRHALREPLAGSFRVPVGKLRIVANFYFGIFGNRDTFPKQDPPIQKNVLNLYQSVLRYRHVIQGRTDEQGRQFIEANVLNSIDAALELFAPSDEEARLMEGAGI